MTKLTKITISKRKDGSDPKRPTHDIVAADDNYNNKTVIGSLWTRVTQDGNKFLSGQLQSARKTVDGKEFDGYVILTQREYDELKSGNPTNGEVSSDDLDF